MHPQLQAIVSEFESGTARLHGLAGEVPPARWGERLVQEAWSVGECVAHLNLTTVAFRPLVEKALEDARRRRGDRAPSRYTRGVIGGLLWRVLGQFGRFKTRTSPAFVPGAGRSRDDLVEEFDRLQAEQVGWVRAADGLPLASVRVASAFNPRVRYNLFACLSILARHQHRHLWQAEHAWRALAGRQPSASEVGPGPNSASGGRAR